MATQRKPVTSASRKVSKAKESKSTSDRELRIRMYRVGFGDFLLMTVPSPDGPQHILIDCGVTNGKTGHGDIHTLKGAVAHMAEETDHKLALIVVTHRHQDHIIGFSRCASEFQKFKVGAIWMPIWETEYEGQVRHRTGTAGARFARRQPAHSHCAGWSPKP